MVKRAVKKKLLPTSGSLSTQMLPRMSCPNLCDIVSPSPVPP